MILHVTVMDSSFYLCMSGGWVMWPLVFIFNVKMIRSSSVKDCINPNHVALLIAQLLWNLASLFLPPTIHEIPEKLKDTL